LAILLHHAYLFEPVYPLCLYLLDPAHPSRPYLLDFAYAPYP
jgi:hypothetical protein